MEQFKRTINLNKIEGDFLYFNIHLTQKIDDMGMFTDFPVISNLDERELTLSDKFGRPDNVSIESWFDENSILLSGTTDSRLLELRTYNLNDPYLVNFDVDAGVYSDYEGNIVDGVTRVTKYDENEKIYVFDTNNDTNIGTDNQTTGLRYIDSNNNTKVLFIGQGNNNLNSSLSAIIKEDYLMGVTGVLETKSDIFIDRGTTNVMERILKMSEVNNLNQLIAFGNGYFNVVNR